MTSVTNLLAGLRSVSDLELTTTLVAGEGVRLRTFFAYA